MQKTKFLTLVVICTCGAILLYLFYVFFDEVLLEIDSIVDLLINPTIVIPSENFHERDYDFKTVKQTNNFKPENIEDIKSIYYTVLNNGWNNFTFYCPHEYETCADDVKTIGNDSEFISLINNYVSAYNTYRIYNTLIVANDEIYLTVEKLYSDEEITEVDKYLDKVIEKLKIDKNNVTIDDLQNIHNYLIKTITYDYDYIEGDMYSISNKAYGALIKKKAICSGYADTFSLFMDRLNIPNFKITSDNHVWNAIYFNNKWTNIDVTWDDDELNPYNYNFFMISSKEIIEKDSKEHTYNQSLYLELN